MKKTVLLSIALITAGFLFATAQNNISMPERYPGENASLESPNFEPPNLPAIKKAKSGQVWWEPDTVYIQFDENRRPYDRFINKYNSYGLLKERIEQWFSIRPTDTDSSWVNHSSLSYTYTYDSNNNVLTCLVNNSSLYTYTYDLNNNVLTCLVNNSKLYTYTYDSSNNVLTELEQNWKNNSWENYQLYTYTYDSNNNVLTELYQLLKNNSWSDGILQSYTYTYDSNNNILTRLVENAIEISKLYTYTYDSNDNRLSELFQLWRNNSWVNYVQNLMTYDENGNGTSVESWVWWEESWLPNYNLNSYILLYYNNMQNNFQWSGCHKLTASYTNVADLTAIAKPPATPDLNAISIYPNPTAGELRITNYGLRIEDIRIFDMAGVNVLNTQQTTLDISHLPAGIYFVQIKTGKGIVTKKIVKL